MSTIQLVEPTLRDRAAKAACSLHNRSGRWSETCEVGLTITDAVLAEVRNWLLERAEAAPVPFAAAALRVAADQIGLTEGRD